jgi:hypothetical protein
MRRLTGVMVAMMLAAIIAACNHDTTDPSKLSAGVGCAPSVSVAPASSTVLTVLGQGPIASRYSGEVDARGTTAYTTTWGGATRTPGVTGNAVFIWDVSGDLPVLVDSLIVPSAATLGDIAISDDGSLLSTPAAASRFTTFQLRVRQSWSRVSRAPKPIPVCTRPTSGE